MTQEINANGTNVDDVDGAAHVLAGFISTMPPFTEKNEEITTLRARCEAAERCKHGVRRPHECRECEAEIPASTVAEFQKRMEAERDRDAAQARVAALETQIAVMRDEESQRVKLKAVQVLIDKNQQESDAKSRAAMESVGISTGWSYACTKSVGAMTLELVEVVKSAQARVAELVGLLREARTWMRPDTGFMNPQDAKIVRANFNEALIRITAAIGDKQ